MSNKQERRSHQPKGGMCASCADRVKDCSKLPFEEMPVIRTVGEGVRIVACTEYRRGD
jgi:hypothetical protein